MVNPLRYFYHNILPVEWKAKVKQIRYPEINPNNAYLPIFLESETIFVHIPKTAGTSGTMRIKLGGLEKIAMPYRDAAA